MNLTITKISISRPKNKIQFNSNYCNLLPVIINIPLKGEDKGMV